MNSSLITVAWLTLMLFYVATACNKDLCGPVVLKCQLLDKCDCDIPSDGNLESCECCLRCAECLKDSYPLCCSCVGMCSSSVNEDSDAESSSVQDLKEPIKGLFSALTEQGSNSPMWTIHKYPAYADLMERHGLHQPDVNLNGRNQEMLSTNCTVAYIKECVSLSQCKHTCRSMGAAKFRWFHDQGCCECVGEHCIDYGKSTALCESCPHQDNSVPKDEL